jgi:UDPglucose 6-dehydrogenase
VMAVRGAHAVVRVTEWPAYVEMNWAAACQTMAAPRAVFDGRNALDAVVISEAGGLYMAVGRDGGHRASAG